MGDPPDDVLLELWRNGDREAGGILLDRYFAQVCRFFANKLPDDLEDLVQQTFLACAEGTGRIRDGASFRSYLFGAAHNLLRARLREKTRRSPDALDELVLAEVTASPSSIVADRREQRLLLLGLRALPLAQQVALELYFWEHLSAPQISASLGIPEGTVRTRLRDGKARLAQQIDRLRKDPRTVATTASDVETWAAEISAMLSSWKPPGP
jgi:RNA polymerase sigma-70 factor (ECF subfamily)